MNNFKSCPERSEGLNEEGWCKVITDQEINPMNHRRTSN